MSYATTKTINSLFLTKIKRLLIDYILDIKLNILYFI